MNNFKVSATPYPAGYLCENLYYRQSIIGVILVIVKWYILCCRAIIQNLKNYILYFQNTINIILPFSTSNLNQKNNFC